MNLKQLTDKAVEVLRLLAQGYAIMHGSHGFTAGAAVPRSGKICLPDPAQPIQVEAATTEEIEKAGVPLHSYEHNIAEGWKTVIPLPERDSVGKALKETEMKNTILVFWKDDAPQHRFCTEPEARTELDTIVSRCESGVAFFLENRDAELIYELYAKIRERVAAAKAKLKVDMRLKLALDDEAVPLDRDLRAKIARAFDKAAAC